MRTNYLIMFFVLVLMLVVLPSNAVLVDAENDEASKALAESYPFMGCGAAWREIGGTRYSAGSCTLIKNNAREGAWLLTAGHAAYDDLLCKTYTVLRYTFESCYYSAFPKGTSMFLEDKSIAAENQKVFYHPTQDVALIKLEHLVYNATGDLITPAEFYQDQLMDNQIILFGGSGQTGIPSQASESGTGYRDGYKRCARGRFIFFLGSEGTMEFDRSVLLPGIASLVDSGGFTAVETENTVRMVGIILNGSGSGENMLVGFEYIGTGFRDWMDRIISANAESESSVSSWDSYQ